MTRLILVRHGEAAAGWAEDLDPGLSPSGIAQADAMADALEPLGPMALVASPLRRTQETAAPLGARWFRTAQLDQDVAEVPSPTDDLHERGAWLAQLFAAPWGAWPADTDAWRQRVVARLVAQADDTVVVTHFVAITVAVAAAVGGAPPEGFRPGYCSRTVLEHDGERLRLVELGDSGTTVVR